jgi:ribonuclease R
MTEAFKKQILRFLKRRYYSPTKLAALAKSLGVTETNWPEFHNAFKELRQSGKILVGGKNLITLPAVSGRVIGTFRGNQRGFGFVIPFEPTASGDLFIRPADTAGAMTGDIVVAKTIKKGIRAGRMRHNGVIVEILQRGRNEFVGTLKQTGSQWFVQPSGKGFFDAILVDDVSVKGARVDDKVVVEIVSYPAQGKLARGVIVDVLGKAGLYDSETKSIIAQYNLPGEFSPDCVDQAREAAEHFGPDAADGRDDITDGVIITIDPEDAKDFDDAISLRKEADGNWVLGVHIADVSAFVSMGSPLDVVAKKRGNSVYLPGKVLPMLPEMLSNGICSLQPGQKRFAKSVYITYDQQGNVLGSEFANSVIRSTARLTYAEADGILTGKATGFPGEVVALLKDMEVLARTIEKRRLKNGMLHLELPEIELVMDEAGRVVDAHPADDSYPHTIIEMFMVEANEAVASLLDRFGVPFMRRIHPEPAPASVKELGRFVKLCNLKVPRRLNRTAIRDLLSAVKGTNYSYAVNIHILRSLQRAEYAPMHIGHFALASTHYCHFTSPIRRYADLLVHRLLGCYLEHRLNLIGLDEVLPEGELAEIGSHITFTEQRAEDAEKELKTVLILQMLTEHIGDQLHCVVSGLTNFGVFVQCTKFGIEGLVEFGDLGLDEWKYDDRAQAVLGLHSGKSVHLGQDITVTIVSVNVAARQLNLAPVEPLVDSRQRLNDIQGRKRARKKQNQKRGRRRR